MLELILGKYFNNFISKIIILILKFKGIKIGKGVFIKKPPDLKINGKISNIIIGDNVEILGKIDIRNRENGKIIFQDGVIIEGDCRFVAAMKGIIEVKKNTIITKGAIMNGGGNIFIGENSIIGPYNIFNANDHKIDKNIQIITKEFIYGDIIIESNCWTGAHVSIKKDVTLGKGSVIGAHSFVTKNTNPYSINYGIPSTERAVRS
tara:strand:- start:18 stop:635 length:618 start_codon:yes stop_codon:yes gene_type:complete